MQVFWTETAISRLLTLKPTDQERQQVRGITFDPANDAKVYFVNPHPLEGDYRACVSGRFCLVYKINSDKDIEVATIVDTATL
jgi:hypothetical protein